MFDKTPLFILAQTECKPGGWALQSVPDKESIDKAEDRWINRSYIPEATDENGWIRNQCGGCKYFAALGSDFGICYNKKSQLDGCITFEHGGCLAHSIFEENQLPAMATISTGE